MDRYTAYFIDSAGTRHTAGQLIVQESGRDLRIQFKYDANYLANKALPDLDPVALKKRPGIFNFEALPKAFDDCLPGAWGKRWLARTKGLSRPEQRDFNLLSYIDEGQLGGLFFKNSAAPEIQDLDAAAKLAEMILTVDANGDLELVEGTPTDAGHSSGGMRPKFTATLKNKPVLVKLESSRDLRDVVRLENICMNFAARCGLNTAATSVESFNGKSGLCVERFDINSKGGRHHKVSMKTLLEAQEHTVAGYTDLAQILYRYSAAGKEDALQLFRQMLINVLINNTDDHLKNFEMHFRDDGWRLTPAYDLVPGDGSDSYHATRFGYNEYITGWNDLLDLTKRFRISKEDALQIRSEVLVATDKLPSIIADSGLNQRDAEWFIQLISKQKILLS